MGENNLPPDTKNIKQLIKSQNAINFTWPDVLLLQITDTVVWDTKYTNNSTERALYLECTNTVDWESASRKDIWPAKYLLKLAPKFLYRPNAFFCYPNNSVKAQMNTQSSDPQQEKSPTELILSSSTSSGKTHCSHYHAGSLMPFMLM